MSKTTLTRPVADMTGNPADEPVSREDFPFPDYLKKLGCKEEDYILYRLENGIPAWKPRYDRRKKTAARLEELFKNAPRTEFDDMTDEEVMDFANGVMTEVRAEEKAKKSNNKTA